MKSVYSIVGIKSIDEIIAESFEISVEDMKKRGRKRTNADARMFAMWFKINYTKNTAGQIGAMYEGRDRVTALHARKAINNMRKTNKAFREKTNQIVNRLIEAGYGKN